MRVKETQVTSTAVSMTSPSDTATCTRVLSGGGAVSPPSLSFKDQLSSAAEPLTVSSGTSPEGDFSFPPSVSAGQAAATASPPGTIPPPDASAQPANQMSDEKRHTERRKATALSDKDSAGQTKSSGAMRTEVFFVPPSQILPDPGDISPPLSVGAATSRSDNNMTSSGTSESEVAPRQETVLSVRASRGATVSLGADIFLPQSGTSLPPTASVVSGSTQPTQSAGAFLLVPSAEGSPQEHKRIAETSAIGVRPVTSIATTVPDTNGTSLSATNFSYKAPGPDLKAQSAPGQTAMEVSDIVVRFGTLFRNKPNTSDSGMLASDKSEVPDNQAQSSVVSDADPRDALTNNILSGRTGLLDAGSGTTTITASMLTSPPQHSSASIDHNITSPASGPALDPPPVSSALAMSVSDIHRVNEISPIELQPNPAVLPVSRAVDETPADNDRHSFNGSGREPDTIFPGAWQQISPTAISPSAGASITAPSPGSTVNNTNPGDMSRNDSETPHDNRQAAKTAMQPFVSQLASAIEGLHNAFMAQMSKDQDQTTRGDIPLTAGEVASDIQIGTGDQTQASSTSLTTLSMTIQTANTPPIQLSLEGQNGLTRRIVLQGGSDSASHSLNATRHDLIAALTAAGIDTGTIRIDIVSPASPGSGIQTHEHHSQSGMNPMPQGQDFTNGGQGSNPGHKHQESRFRTTGNDALSDIYVTPHNPDPVTHANGRLNITA